MSSPLRNPPAGRPRGNSAGKNKPPPIPGPKLNEAIPPERKEAYRPGKMYSLVICGATTTSDADQAMFADFMGIAGTLRLFSEECKGTFLSCFPIEQYFAEKPHTDIKFGKVGPSNTALFTYSARKHSTRDGLFFDQIPKEKLLVVFTQWIQNMAHATQPGDVINVFLQCHGDPKGRIGMGTKPMDSLVLANMLETFPAGVQVNCIGSHCHSGILVNAIKATGGLNRYAISACGPDEFAWTSSRSVSNRCRGFRFALPFVQSLAKCKLPTVHQTEAGPLTADHFHNFVKDALRRVGSGGGESQSVQTHLSAQQQASLILLEELILRDQVDVIKDPRLLHRRRRFEWPVLDLPNLRRLQQASLQGIPPTAINQVVSVVNAAVSAAYGAKMPDNHIPGESNLINELEKKNTNYEMILNNLYWRGRQQSTAWDLWIILCNRGLVSWENMEAEIDYSNGGTCDAGKIYRWLACFTAVRGEDDLLADEPFPGFCMSHFPLMWLAIMISRGCSDEPPKILEVIHQTGMLGNFDPNLVPLIIGKMDDHYLWHCDPKSHGRRPEMPNTRYDYLGSWLPHGLGSNTANWPTQIVDKFMSRFWAVEKAYKEFYQIPDGQLVEECHQAEFLRRHSNYEPRWKHSGHWKPQ